jgi:tripartite-type tricarboxylate transporter receptor subunit TctC
MLALETNSMSRISLIAALALAAGSATAAAEDWPTRPITMVVPFAARGGSDLVGRMIAPRLGELLGQQVVIENLGGSGGMLAAIRSRGPRPTDTPHPTASRRPSPKGRGYDPAARAELL